MWRERKMSCLLPTSSKGLPSGSPFECHLSKETERQFVKIRSLVTEENRGMGLRADPVSSHELRKSSFNVCPQTHNTKAILIKKRHMKKEYRVTQQLLSNFKMITGKEMKRKLTQMVKEKECLDLKFPVDNRCRYLLLVASSSKIRMMVER